MKRLLAVGFLLAFAWTITLPAQQGQSAVLYPVEQDFSHGYIDAQGKLVVPLTYAAAEEFSEGMAAVSVRGEGRKESWGYLNLSGKLAIPAGFDTAENFAEGLAAVCVARKCGFIDKTGRTVIPLQFEAAGSFRGGLAPVSASGLFGYINHAGTFVIPAKYLDAKSFSEERAAVMPQGSDKYGFINPKGELVIPATFDAASDFAEGVAAVRVNGKWGGVDKSGTLKFPPSVDKEFRFSEGFAAICRNHPQGKDFGELCGFVMMTGEPAFPTGFAHAGPFSEGLAPVTFFPTSPQDDYADAYIDTTGKVVIRLSEPYNLSPFHNGLAKICKETMQILAPPECQVIDRTGKVVWKAQSSWRTPDDDFDE